MDEQILYHGSPVIIRKPEIDKGKTYNDFGKGFYCTRQKELAKEWACPERQDGFCNKYLLSMPELQILDLRDKRWTILHWLALLLEFRVFRLSSALMKEAADFLKKEYLPEIKEADVIIGYRADDSYFSFARDFISNSISLRQLSEVMHLGDLGEQVVLKSAKAFEQIRFAGYAMVNHEVYYPLRMERDRKARETYREIRNRSDRDGIYMLDLLRGDVKNDDPRIQ